MVNNKHLSQPENPSSSSSDESTPKEKPSISTNKKPAQDTDPSFSETTQKIEDQHHPAGFLAGSDSPGSQKELKEHTTQATPLYEDKIERIQASKVALPGLKVLGKIELSEVKESTEVSSEKTLPSVSDLKKPTEQKEATRRPHVRNKTSKKHSNLHRGKADYTEKEKREHSRRAKKRCKKHYQGKISRYSMPSKPLSKMQSMDHEVYDGEKNKKEGWLYKITSWFISS